MGDLGAECMEAIADTFFGTRRKVEEEIRLVTGVCHALEKKAEEVTRCRQRFQSALLGTEAAAALFTAIGLPVPREMRPAGQETPAGPSRDADSGAAADGGPVTLIRKWTGSGRYERLVLDRYDRFQNAVAGYLRGRDENDAVCLRVVRHMAALVNKKVEQVNTHHSPEAALGQAARFQGALETPKAGAMGGGFNRTAGSLSAGMAFSPVNLSDFHLPEYPDLPPVEAVRRPLGRIARRQFSRHKSEALRFLSQTHS
ncbi:MAG: hypothetical protein CSB33_04845 [Desulfobacterales bacterium]|nr:MAG: hypothetical protein CSB33_04845 [Desulfobacterales bacterium]